VGSCNTSSGYSAEVFGKIIDSADSEKQKAEQQRCQDTGRKLEEVYDGTRKLTSTLCFQVGGVLDEAMLNAVTTYKNKKK